MAKRRLTSRQQVRLSNINNLLRCILERISEQQLIKMHAGIAIKELRMQQRNLKAERKTLGS
jgi:hypothetical protein